MNTFFIGKKIRYQTVGRTDGRTDERTGIPPVFYRTLSPSGLLPNYHSTKPKTGEAGHGYC